MVDLVAQHAPLRREMLDAIGSLVDRGSFVLGEAVERFEREAASYLGSTHAIGVSSGTDAIYLALRSLGVGPGDEVITPAFTFFAISEAIERSGSTPVFVDVDPQSLNLDPSRVAERIGPRTRAIVPVHLFGHPAPVEAIREAVGDRGIAIIEDGAQAFGAAAGGKRVGSLGDLGAFSFYPTKNLGACGDGGLVVTDRDDLAQSVRRLRDHGQSEKYRHSLFGWNCRLDAIQAVILSIKLAHLDEWNEARRRIAARYRELLTGLPVALPPESKGVHTVYHQFTIRLKGRDHLRAFLADRGIASAVHYPYGLHEQPVCLEQSGSFPFTERAAREVLSLPIYPEMEEVAVKRVAAALREWAELDRIPAAGEDLAGRRAR